MGAILHFTNLSVTSVEPRDHDVVVDNRVSLG